jgi:hypothetical protein
MTWAQQGLGGASLGDARLSRRLGNLATRLAKSPSSSIPQACRGWAQMRAAYRFLAHNKGDGEPGLKTLWQGMQDMKRAVQAVAVLREAVCLDSKCAASH